LLSRRCLSETPGGVARHGVNAYRDYVRFPRAEQSHNGAASECSPALPIVLRRRPPELTPALLSMHVLQDQTPAPSFQTANVRVGVKGHLDSCSGPTPCRTANRRETRRALHMT